MSSLRVGGSMRIPGGLRGRTLVRASIALGAAAAAAVAVGALQGGAATPQTQSVTVPDKAGQSTSITWSGTIPAVSPHPTSNCNGAGVGSDDEGIAITVPRKGYDHPQTSFKFQITWTPSNPLGDGSYTYDDLTVNGPDGQDPDHTEAGEVGSSDAVPAAEPGEAVN